MTDPIPANTSMTRNVQALNVEWASIDAPDSAAPATLKDLLETSGVHTRLGYPTIDDFVSTITAVAFLPRTGNLQLRTKADDASNVRTIAAADVGYIPAIMIWSKYVSVAGGETIQVELLHDGQQTF
jgi:hypothetical protein